MLTRGKGTQMKKPNSEKAGSAEIQVQTHPTWTIMAVYNNREGSLTGPCIP